MAPPQLPLRRLLLTAFAATVALSGCSAESGSPTTSGAEPLSVVASFYPLQFVAQQIGGDQVTVTSLTKPGAEPHDLELAPQDVAAVTDADLALYLSGFQPAVDTAIAQQAPDHSLDVADAAQLSLTYSPAMPAEDDSAVAGTADPHFWLDPQRLADVGDAVATRLIEISPEQASTFETNAAELRSALGALDAEFSDGLATCDRNEIVTSHNAFGYLADAYGLEQVGIAGLTPDSEPNPQDLAAVTDFVAAHDVSTVYYETLVSPEIADTVAATTGATTDVLDPIEGIADDSQGANYLEIMRANLGNLRKGLSCH